MLSKSSSIETEDKIFIYSAKPTGKIKWQPRPLKLKLNRGVEFSLLTGLLVAALLLRLVGLNRTSLWFDESFNVVLSHELSLWQNLTLHEYFIIHPPLFFVILHLWTNLGGLGEFWVRFFSVIVAGLTLGAFYLLSKYWLNRRIAFSALLFLAVSPLHLHWSQSIRGYAWFTLLTVMSMAALWWVSQKPFHPGRWVLYGLSALILIYTEYLGFYLIFSQLIFIGAVFYKERQVLWRAGITLLGVAVGFGPYGPSFIDQAQHGPANYLQNQGPVQLLEMLENLTSWYIPNSLTFVAGAVCLPLYLIGVRWLWQTQLRLAILLASWSLLPWLSAWLSSLIRPSFEGFYFVCCVPPTLLLIAAGAWSLHQRHKPFVFYPYLAIGAVVALSLAACFNFTQNYHNQDWRSAVNYIVAHRQPGDIIFLPNGYGYTQRAFDYYYLYQLGSPGKMELRTVPDNPSPQMIVEAFKGSQRIWMIGLYSNTNASIWLKVIPLLPANYKATYYQQYWGNQGQLLALSLLEQRSSG